MSPLSAPPERQAQASPGCDPPFLGKLTDWRVLAGIILGTALAIRLLFWLQWGQTPYGNEAIIDSAYFDRQAVAISEGQWLPDRVFYVPPVYQYLLAVIYTLFGHSLDVVRLLQNLLGSLNCLLIALIAARLFGRNAGLTAGLMAALYRPFIFYDSMILKTTWDLLCTALFCLSALKPTATLRQRDAALSGVFLGLAILLRGNMIFLIPCLPLWWLFGPERPAASAAHDRRSWLTPDRRRLPLVVAHLLGVALCLLPVTASNYLLGHDLVLTGYSSGPNLWLGNNAEAMGVLAYPANMTAKEGNMEGEEAYFRTQAEEAAGRSLKPSEVSSFWIGKAREFVLSQPLDWAILTAKKFLYFWNNHEVPDNYDLTFLRQEFGTVLNGPLLCFGLVAPLAGVGIFSAWRQRRGVAGLLLGLSLVYVLSVMPFIIIDRYRLPLLVLFLPLASHGLLTLVEEVKARRPAGLGRHGLILAAVALLSWAPLVDTSMGLHVNYTNLGSAYQNQNDFPKAKDYFAKAIALMPEYALALHNLGVVQLIMGENEAALANTQRAIASDPTYSEAYHTLGEIQTAMNDYEGARQSFRKALAINPSFALAYNSLGLLAAAEGDHRDALEDYQRALELDPTLAEAYNNLGIAHYQLKEPEQAIAAYQRALALAPDFADAYNNLGLVYLEQGDLQTAREMYEQALALRPDFLEAQANLQRLTQGGR